MLLGFLRFVNWDSTSDLRRLDHAAVRGLSFDISEGAAKIYQNGAHHKVRVGRPNIAICLLNQCRRTATTMMLMKPRFVKIGMKYMAICW